MLYVLIFMGAFICTKSVVEFYREISWWLASEPLEFIIDICGFIIGLMFVIVGISLM